MKFGINLGGGDRKAQSREEGLAARLGKARLAKEMATIPCGLVRAI